MKALLAATLGILTAIGGFVDIGDIVASSQAGARYGMGLAWVMVVGVLAICVYAEMAGRVTALSHRPVFDLVRERLGPRVALANLAGSYVVTLLTLGAEIGGVALAIQLAVSVSYLVWVPLAGLAVWLVLWRIRFDTMERVFGLAGLALVIFVVAVLKLPTRWGDFAHQATHAPLGSGAYWLLAVSLFASAVTPYEVFFFSSGGVEEKWTPKDLATERTNVLVGFPLGGVLSLGLMACAAVVFHPHGEDVQTLAQAAVPVQLAFGKAGLALVIFGFFACTFGAALETGLSAGYTVAQYFGWQWGKMVRPRQAARFHTVLLVSLLIAVAVLLTGVDPVQLTEYMLVGNAVVLPLTYLPILIVANDREYLGDKVNGRLANALGGLFLVVLLAAALAAIPLVVFNGLGG